MNDELEDEYEEVDDVDVNQALINACMAAFSTDEDPWFLDSWASSHVTGNASSLTDLTESIVSSIRTASGQVLPVMNKGIVTFSNPAINPISDVPYVPGVKTNLILVGTLTDLGHVIVFTLEKLFGSQPFLYKHPSSSRT